MELQTPDANLCYLEAARVGTPAGRLVKVPLCDPNGDRLGTVKGVLISPTERRVRYFVVECERPGRPRPCLLSTDDPIRMQQDEDGGAVYLEADAASSLVNAGFDVSSVRRMSEEDVIAAIFSNRAA